MNNKCKLAKNRNMLALTTMAVALSASSFIAMTAHAQTLPPPPVSPAPVTDYEYDAKGNPTKVIKAKGVAGFGFETKSAYDALDRVKTSTDARNGVTQLGYDGIDQLKQITDPRNLVTTYQRNGLGNMTQLVSPDTGTANGTFDPNGNLLTRVDSRGVQGTYTYDPLNRITSAIYTKSGQTTQNYSWTYDQTGGDFGAGIGRLTTATSPSTTTKYGYDIRGRVITVIQSIGGVTLTTRYGYNDASNITSITYPSGRVLRLQYDAELVIGMPLAKDATSTPKPLIGNVKWQPFGPVTNWDLQLNAGPKTVQRVYDVYGRLVRYPLNGVVRDITYDAADRIVSYTQLDATTGQVTAEAQAMNQSFGYDELGRLTSISTPANFWTIGYDANGNRTGVTLNGTIRTYTTETTSNRLSAIDNPTRGFGYDAAGNTLSDTGLGYTTTYGLDNRLATLTAAGVTTTYSYDAGGQRVRKVTGTSRPHYMYDQGGQLLGEYNSSGGALQEFVWLGNTLIAVLTNSTTGEPRVYYAYSDHLNTPRVIVNAAGDARWRWIAEPFGTTAAETIPNSLENLVVNLRFPGQYFDKESGLHYNYFRDYDGATGRYVQSDPIGLVGGVNTFGYVNGSPAMRVDRSGLLDIFVGGAGDSTSEIVKTFQREFQKRYSQRNSAYFEWTDRQKIIDDILTARKANACEPINLIGHSYGGSTVVTITQALNAMGIGTQLLITIDPVSRFSDRQPGGTRTWINVNAAPDFSNGLGGDAWASIGGKWGDWPARRADAHYATPFHHNEFNLMFNQPSPWGTNALQALLNSNSGPCGCP